MEVATLTGGAILSATFELLLSKLNSFVSERLDLHEKVRGEMENWKNLLPKIGALLEDAEERQVGDRLVKLWLADLKDLFYDMEDILEEVEIDAKRFELFAKAQASTSKPRKLIFSKLFDKVGRFTAKGDRKMASRVEDITARLQHIEADIHKLGLVDLMTRDKSCKVAAERLSTTPLLENHVCGREDDQEAILRMLLCDEGRHEPYSVIPIVGMGGLGKTTLARLVYNDEKLKGMFGLKAWVCISEVFDVFQITRSILMQVTEKTSDSEDLTSLQQKLKKKFLGQKFLLVLDDIWNVKYDQWDNLQKPFLSGAPGSKIIITTRHKNIGQMMKGNDEVYYLALLKNDACLSLFARHALRTENFSAYPDLKGVGEEIVTKCKGLPLAIKTLGGLLRGTRHHDEWENILKSDIWSLPEHSSGIPLALRLSYTYLPSHLKRCFAYCSLFPKDYEFEEAELVLLWIAEGLLRQQPREMKKMLDIGREYFRDLLSRSFFQRSDEDVSLFVMHDLIVDLSVDVAGGTCYTLEMDGKRSNQSLENARHLSLVPCTYEVSERFEFLGEKRNLRTFMWLKNRGWVYFLSNTLLQDLMQNLKYLRVLSLPDCSITRLSDSIADLKHLRYINLSGAEIKSLPDSVGYLIYLQTLLLRSCIRLSKLPATIGNLLDLQHLDITETESLKEIPSEIINLKSLVILPKFIIGNARGLRLKDLKNLSCLQGQLSILDLHNVLDANDAKEANLYKIQGLDDLSLEWCFDSQNLQNVANEKQVLHWLKPHQALKRLSINSFGGLEFPSWIGDPSFTKLEVLKLSNCQRSTSLPSLERLPKLKELIIKGMRAVQTMMLEFDGDNSSSPWVFPALESLELQDCPILGGKFPKCIPFLKKLEIRKCPKLICSSVSLPSLEKLYISKCSEAVLRSMFDVNSLKTLSISSISKLTSLPKSFVESLKALEDMEIGECDELTCLWEEGANIANLARLKRISIQNCSLLVSLTGKEQSFLPEALESYPGEITMMMQPEELRIRGCSALRMFPRGKLPTTLKVLEIWGCEKLESLPEGMLMNNGDAMMQLEELHIRGCSALRMFPRGKLPTTLKVLKICGCEKLESLPEGMLMNNGDAMMQLEELHIRGCSALRMFPRGKLPTTLKVLKICGCEKLESLPEGMLMNNGDACQVSHLEELCIASCPCLKSFPSGHLPNSFKCLVVTDCVQLEFIPQRMLQYCTELKHIRINGGDRRDIFEGYTKGSRTSLRIENYPGLETFYLYIPNLKSLAIKNCRNLKSLPDKLQDLTSLDDLDISFCPGIESIPDGGLPTNLTALTIIACPGIRSIPDGGLPPNLRSLNIRYCRGIESIPNCGLLLNMTDLSIFGCPRIESIPDSGFPPNLQKLSIDCGHLKQPMQEWGLSSLTSLLSFSIYWICPPDDVLPTSLTSLSVYQVENMKSISRGLLRNLNSLQYLTIEDWPKLQSLPNKVLPPSLQYLDIHTCPNFQSLPKKGLPHSLKNLCIINCPIVERRCLEEKGDYWPLIARIPALDVRCDEDHTG